MMLLFCFSEFYKMKFGNLVEICFWLNLAVKGLSFFARHFITCFGHCNIFAKIRRRMMMTFCRQNDSGSYTHEKLVLRKSGPCSRPHLRKISMLNAFLTYYKWAGVMLFKEKDRSVRATKLQASVSDIS